MEEEINEMSRDKVKYRDVIVASFGVRSLIFCMGVFTCMIVYSLYSPRYFLHAWEVLVLTFRIVGRSLLFCMGRRSLYLPSVLV